MKAREFLARKKIEPAVRNLVREPLTVPELKRLAKLAGGAERLIAPKRRAEAEALSGGALLRWLSEDGGRLRRPIVEVEGKLKLGFAKDAQAQLEGLL